MPKTGIAELDNIVTVAGQVSTIASNLKDGKFDQALLNLPKTGIAELDNIVNVAGQVSTIASNLKDGKFDQDLLNHHDEEVKLDEILKVAVLEQISDSSAFDPALCSLSGASSDVM